MFEETVSVLSIWGYMVSWLTPTVLFVVLNVMIGTIAVTSGFGSSNQYNKSHNKDDHHPHHPTHNHDPADQLQQSPIQTEPSRSPSALQRLNPISYNSSSFQQFHPSVATTTALTTNPVQHPAPVEKINPDLDAHLEELLAPDIENRNGEVHEEDQMYGKIQMSRSKSETMPSGIMKVQKLQEKMVKRSASDASVVKPVAPEEKEEEKDQEIVRVEGRPPVVPVDEEVDAKADDFINKFKQQLKSQNL